MTIEKEVQLYKDYFRYLENGGKKNIIASYIRPDLLKTGFQISKFKGYHIVEYGFVGLAEQNFNYYELFKNKEKAVRFALSILESK